MTSQASQSSRKPPKVKQACDCCHARKIRCDGTQPCNNCQITSLPCSYLSVPKKKGPKGPSKRTPRAILKMQMLQQHSKSPENHYVNVQPALSPPLSSLMQDGNESSRTGFEPSPLLSDEVARHYAKKFFKHKYPVMPILHRGRFFDAVFPNFRSSPELYALMASICAAVISQAQPDPQSVPSPDSSSDTFPTVEFFINEVKRARQYWEYVEKPSLNDVQTSFFLFAALFNCDRHNSAWFYLREAMTILQLRMDHEEETYQEMDEYEAVFSRRTFWLLFLTERAYALQRHRPLTLQRSIDLPTISPDDPDAPIISGFLDLVSLFQNFDDSFVSIWNTTTRTPTSLTPDASPVSSSQLAALQLILEKSIPDVSKRTEIQQADLLISRLWLKTMVWQLCVAKGLLSSNSENESLSFRYPVTLARDLVLVGNSLDPKSFEPHGPGILEKIFDIGCSLADVLQLQSSNPGMVLPTMEVGPRDYLMEILRVMSSVMGGSSRFLSLLATKADECLYVGPRTAPEPSGGRVFEIEGENNHPASASFEDSIDDYDPDAAQQFDFGALSEASIAWLADDNFVDAIPGEHFHSHENPINGQAI